MKEPVFLDLRNIYAPEQIKEYDIEYTGVGVTAKDKYETKTRKPFRQNTQ